MRQAATGSLAETAAAEYLQKQGFEMLERNWRSRWCEIDLIAKKGDIIYFVEVKYRRGSNQGEGLSYITPTKLKQMRFAANFWLAVQAFDGDCELAAVGLAGDDFAVTDFLVGLD
jgi:uncharacterized protein (TIGR00252 family)